MEELSNEVELSSGPDEMAAAVYIERLLLAIARISGVRAKQSKLAAAVGELKDAASKGDVQAEHNLRVLERVMFLAYDDFTRFGLDIASVALEAEDMEAEGPLSLWDVVREGGALEKFAAITVDKHEALSSLIRSTDSRVCSLIVLGILAKDLRCGIAAKTIQKVFPGLLTEFEVMLASPAKADKFHSPSLVEVKYDGMRVIAQATPSSNGAIEVSFFTRSGRPIPAMSDLFVEPVARLADRLFADKLEEFSLGACFDGEIVVEGDFNDLISDARKKSEPMKEGTFWIFDVIPVEVASGLAESKTLLERREDLAIAFGNTPSDALVRMTKPLTASSFAEAELIYRNIRQIPLYPGATKTHEGVIIKNPNGKWQRKRSTDWMKMKACESVDAVVVGYFYGAGKYENMLGGLIIDFNGVEVSVGSGFSDSQRELYIQWAIHDEANPESRKLIGRMIEVEYQEVTNDGSLRHPVFVRLRSDKDIAEF